MLYKIAHFLQEKFSFIWDLIEILNAWLFSLRYGRKLKKIQPILTKHQGDFIVREANLKDVDAIVTFFEVQPKESFDFFKPHPFDASTTRKLIKNKSYLFFIVLDGSQVVGYFFLRSFFVGKSYLDMISKEQVGVGNVTFEPACRNNWHIHHAKKGGGQILIATAGRGYYQEWGKPAVELKPGDVVNIPAGVKHWHGAAPDSWFQHLAIEVPGEGGSNEWLEPVSDEDYGKLK